MASTSKAFSGKGGSANRGTVNGQKICDLEKWTFEDTYAVPKFATNCTGGRKEGVVGVGDSKGTLTVKVPAPGSGSKLPLAPGTRYTLFLKAAVAGTNDYIQVDGIISSMPIEMDINDGNPVTATYAFEGVGPVTYTGIFAQGDTNCCEVDSSSGA